MFLEVNRDLYEMVADVHGEVKRAIAQRKADKSVSWQRIDQVINQKSGIAEDVTLAAMPD